MSAGNHAQAVAYHAAGLAIPATIVMPVTTPFVKVKATKALWRRRRPRRRDGREAQARAEAERASAISSGCIPTTIRTSSPGQGTIALEMLEEVPDLDVLVIPIGGGGLIAGIATAAQAAVDRDRRRGVCALSVDVERHPRRAAAVGGATLAEGIAVKNVGKLTLPVVRALVSDIVLVDEALIERAVNAFLTLQKAMAEGAGAAGLAAMLAERRAFAGKVGLILCGGNIDPRILASIMVRELERDDRIVSFRLTIADRPGHSRPDRDEARRVRRQYSRGRSSPAVPRHSGQGREARRHRGDARRRACRGDFPGVRGRRLSAGAHRDRRRDGIAARAVQAVAGQLRSLDVVAVGEWSLGRSGRAAASDGRGRGSGTGPSDAWATVVFGFGRLAGSGIGPWIGSDGFERGSLGRLLDHDRTVVRARDRPAPDRRIAGDVLGSDGGAAASVANIGSADAGAGVS